MEFTVRPEVKILYPSAHFGSLNIHNQNNQKKHPDLEKAKHQLEEKIRELEDRMPAHGVKPGMMAEMCDLEDERDAILAKMADLKNN